MLKVEKVSKSFKGQQVLDQVSFVGAPGELIHISGENGSGKSTLFKLITGLTLPDSGTVTTADDDVIGALIENPGFLEYETAMTNLKFLTALNRRFNEPRIIALMTQFKLEVKNNRPVSKYSVGMRQKLGIIQAVMEDQTIILLDEPTRGLDAESVRQFVALLQSLVLANKLVVVASHDHVEGLVYDHAYVIQNGHLEDE